MSAHQKKISIIGTSCSGKTYLGKLLSEQMGYPFLDIDDVYWLPGWTKAKPETVRKKIQQHVAQDAWVIVGNAHSDSQKLIWPHVDTLIWLDIPLYILLWRGIKRSLQNILLKRELCNGNFETVHKFFSKTSIVFWILQSFKKRKQAYGNIFKQKPYPCEYVHLRSSRDVEAFIEINGLKR